MHQNFMGSKLVSDRLRLAEKEYEGQEWGYPGTTSNQRISKIEERIFNEAKNIGLTLPDQTLNQMQPSPANLLAEQLMSQNLKKCYIKAAKARSATHSPRNSSTAHG